MKGKTLTPYQFFHRYAGYSYDPKKQTKTQGRAECAREMAKAEQWARETGVAFQWERDQYETSKSFRADVPEYLLWTCAAVDAHGQGVASLGGIDFGPDGEPWGNNYRRIVEAELALEAMTSETKSAPSVADDSDARLRDAAPELLAALRGLLEYADAIRVRGHGDNLECKAARAAIAKATGGKEAA